MDHAELQSVAGLPRTWRLMQYAMLVLLGVLAVTSFVLFEAVASHSPAHVVNRAGLQRMLSQRIAQQVLLLERASQAEAGPLRAALAASLDRFVQGHASLLERDPAAGLEGANSAAVQARFEQLAPHFADVVAHARAVLHASEKDGLGDAGAAGHVEAVQRAVERFLPLMDAIVTQYDEEARERARLVRTHQRLLLGGSLAVLAAFGLFAIRPALHHIEDAFDRAKRSELATLHSNKELLQANRDLAALLEERGAFEKALRESEERFRTLAETASDAIITVDASTRMYYVNNAAERIFGYARQEMIEKPIGMLIADDVRPKYEGMVRRYFDTGERTVSWQAIELPGKHKAGHTIPLEISLGEYFRDEARFITGVIRDITERHKTETALRQSEDRLELALSGGDLGLWDWDLPTGAVYFNERYATLLGYALNEIEHHVDTWRRLLHPEDAPRVMQVLNEHFEGKRPIYEAEQRLLTKEGTWRWVLARGQVVERDGQGNPTRAAGTIHDMTDHHAAAEAIEHARRQEDELRARIQETLLHAEAPRAIGPLGIAVRTISSQHMDGDFYDILTHAEGVFDVVVGDVMGKGTTAALVGAATKHHIVQTAITLLAQAGAADGPSEAPSPQAIVQRVHEEVTPRLIDLERFVTLVYVRFEDGGRRMRFVNCGHTRALFYHHANGEISFLEGENTALGVIESERYRECVARIEPGDLLLLYSDGVTEAQSIKGAFFGETRLQGLVQRWAPAGPAAVVDRIEQEVRAFTGDRRLADDVTCIALQACGGGLAEPMCFETPSRLDQLAAIRGFVAAACERMNLAEEDAAMAQLAVNEAASNVIRHGYAGRSDGALRFLAYEEGGALVVELRHDGAPFDPASVSTPAEPGVEGGFGLQIIRDAVDDVRYTVEPGGVSLVRLLKRPAANP